MYRYNKTSIILKISIAVLFIIGMVLECSCERSEEPEKRGTGYITCTLRWDSVVAVSPVPEKLRYCIYPSEGGPMKVIPASSQARAKSAFSLKKP